MRVPFASMHFRVILIDSLKSTCALVCAAAECSVPNGFFFARWAVPNCERTNRALNIMVLAAVRVSARGAHVYFRMRGISTGLNLS